MLLHFRTTLAAAIEVHNLRNGNYIGVTQELKVIPLVYDTTDEEFYVATDFDFDTPLDMTGIEVAYMNNQDAIYQQAEIEELIAIPAEEPEEEDEAPALAMAEQEPEACGGTTESPVDPKSGIKGEGFPDAAADTDYGDDDSAINTQL